jgi:hypothetical protein
MNPRSLAHRSVLSCLALAAAVSACGETVKPVEDRGATLAEALRKDGRNTALVAGRLATAMVNGEAQKGTSTIGPGQRLQGRLESTDGRMDDGGYFDAWVFIVDGTSDVAISIESPDFDTYLTLYEGGLGGLGEYIAEDDDGGSDTNSYLQVRLDAGTYTVMAHPFSGEATGAYEIGLEVSGAGSTRTVAAGQQVSGELSPADPVMLTGTPYQDWKVSGSVGQELTITLTSDEFDPFLYVLRGDEVLASNDDFDGLNSQVTLALPTTGAYTLRVSTYETGEGGAFTLSVGAAAAPTRVTDFGSGGAPNGRYALLVGIDDYPGTGSDLRGPIEDARIMHRVLVERFGFDPANIVTLNDANATRQNIAQGVAQHLGQAGPDGVAVLFYSGHGTQIGENIGLTGSLDPEPRGQGDEAIFVYGAEYESSVILDEELGYLIESIDAGRTLVVVDACFSGEITRASGDAPQSKVVDLSDPTVAATLRLPTNLITSELKALNLTDMSLGFGDFQQIAAVFQNPARHIAWGGSTEDQVSWTSSLGNGASVFAYYVGQRMMEVPVSTTFAELNRLVHDDVVGYIESDGNMTMQNPQIRGSRQSMTLEDFFRQR